MRDAFGGVFMFSIFIIFIFIFVAFAAISLNYAKAFKLKNSLISFVEENEIITLSGLQNKYETEIQEVIESSNYHKSCESIGYAEFQEIVEENKTTTYCQGGITISLKEKELIDGTSSYLMQYEIATYATWNLGILNKILLIGGNHNPENKQFDGAWKVTGTAKVVARDIKK